MPTLQDLLTIDHPIIQAPMAGTSSPRLAAAVSNAGALGSLAFGASSPHTAAAALAEFRALSNHAVNINLFCHAPAPSAPTLEAAWIEFLRPTFAQFHAAPPETLPEIYRSFVQDDAMLAFLLEQRPHIVSFHFGLPPADRIAALRSAGITLLATATSPHEAETIANAGIHAIVAQGHEAGGHRSIFNPAEPDSELGTMALTRLLARQSPIPVIAAGGIMDGAGIAAALHLGAIAAQLGTAFIACPESLADAAYRAALASNAAHHTVITAGISGRPARCLANDFTRLTAAIPRGQIPAYPRAYAAGKALTQAAKPYAPTAYAPHWAGQSAPLSRALPAAELVALLIEELRAA